MKTLLLLIIFTLSLYPSQKIISIGPEVTEILIQLELKNQIVSSDQQSKEIFDLYTESNVYEEGIFKTTDVIGQTPDLVVISSSIDLESEIVELKKSGIKVYKLARHKTKDSFLKDLRNIGKLTGSLNKAVDIETDYNTKIIEIDMIKLMNEISSKLILVKYQDGNFLAAPSHSITDDMISLISCDNLNTTKEWADATSLIDKADLVLLDKKGMSEEEIKQFIKDTPYLEIDHNMYEYYINTPDVLLNILNNALGLKF